MRRFITYRIAIVFTAPVLELSSCKKSTRIAAVFTIETLQDVSPDILKAADITSAKQSASLLVGRCEGTVVFVALLSRGWFTIPQRHRVCLPAKSLYVSCCYTLPESRGRGLYGQALSTIGSFASAEGLDAIFLYVEFENEASIRSVLNAGFRPIARSWIIAAGPFARRARVQLRPQPVLNFVELSDTAVLRAA
jgi:L-amino acid N-acyltransferase YncA